MATIEFICGSAHQGEDITRDGPAITLNEDRWAYCLRGGRTGHVWKRIAPATIEELAISRHRYTAVATEDARA